MSELTLTNQGPADVAPIDPTGGRLVAWAKAAQAAHQLARALAWTTFVPKQFQAALARDEDGQNAAIGNATAAIMLGDELGLSPLSALRSIYTIGGTPALYARSMVALVQSHGHEVWTVEESDSKVTVAGKRRGSTKVEQSTWTVDRAKKAGYTSNPKYVSAPADMLYARAASTVCRRIAADVLAGCPTSVEEIELEAGPTTTTVVREPTEKRTVTRQRKEPAPAPEPEEPPLDDEPVWPEPVVDADPITPAQQKALHAALRDAGAGDRDTGLELIASIIGRPVESSKELTKADASRVIDALKDVTT